MKATTTTIPITTAETNPETAPEPPSVANSSGSVVDFDVGLEGVGFSVRVCIYNNHVCMCV